MTVTAPPRPPRSSDPVDRDELAVLVEALIEEARQRARKRRRRYAGAAALALLVGLVPHAGFRGGANDSPTSVASAAPAAPAAPNAGIAASLSFRLLAVETSIRIVDRPPKGTVNKGDAVYAKDELRNGWADQFGRPRNAVVGRDSWVRTGLAEPGGSLDKLNVTLPGGTLRLRARGRMTSQTILFHVVGGTGRFADARGTMTWQRRSGPNLNDYHLQLRKQT